MILPESEPKIIKKRRWKWVILLLVFIGVLVIGLVIYLQSNKPIITATFHYGYQDVTPQETPSVAEIFMKNPNRLPITLDSARYGLFLNGRQVFTGHFSGNDKISAMDKMTLPIPFVFQIEDLIKYSTYSDTGILSLQSVFYVHYWNGETQRMPALWQLHIPQFLSPEVKIESIIPQTATITETKALLSASLLNPGPAAFTTRNAQYILTIDSTEIARDIISYPMAIGPHSAKSFTIPLTINTQKALDALSRHKDSYVLSIIFNPISDKLPAYTGSVTCPVSGTVTSLLKMASSK